MAYSDEERHRRIKKLDGPVCCYIRSDELIKEKRKERKRR